MTRTKKSRALALLGVIFALVLMLCACDPIEETDTARNISERFLDSVMANERQTSYELFGDIGTYEEIDLLFDTMREILNGSTSYEMKFYNYNYSTDNGIATAKSIFEVTTDDSKIFYVLVRFDSDNLSGFNIHNATEFRDDTSFITTLNVVLTVISLLIITFIVLMIVDVFRRKLDKKVIWILVILAAVWITYTVGNENFDFDFSVGIAVQFLNIERSLLYNTLSGTVSLPVGAIIYFFIRKKLSQQKSASEEIKVTETALVAPTEADGDVIIPSEQEGQSTSSENTEENK